MRQAGCGDGDHRGGQSLVGLTAIESLVALVKENINRVIHYNYSFGFSDLKYCIPSVYYFCVWTVGKHTVQCICLQLLLL